MRLRKKHRLRLILFALFGFVSHLANGSSLYPPKLPDFTPSIKFARIGEDVTLAPGSSIDGNPPPTYRWRKFGSGFISSASDESWHNLGSVDESRFGVYHCVANNSFGSVIIKEIRLVRARLEISGLNGASLAPDDVLDSSASRGEFLELTFTDRIVVDSQPAATVRWFEKFNGISNSKREITNNVDRRAVSVGRDSAALLELRNEDNGRLVYVKFENPAALITKESPPWSVKVVASDIEFIPPKIVIPPINAIVNVGEDASFDCVPNAKPWSFLRISWTRDGAPLTADSKYELIHGNRRLVVRNVVEADEGVFACVARMLDENLHPGRDRREARLFVHSVPRIVSSSLPNIFSEVFWGKTKVLRCEGVGNPPPTVTWYKNAEELPAVAWRHIVVAANQSLVVNGAGKEDEGVYQCVVKNEAGSASVVTHLKVKKLKPNIFDIPKNTSVISGDPITLTCPAEGAPPPSFSWAKDGTDIVVSPGTQIDPASGTLTISSSSDRETGEYCCKATNQFGDDAKCTHLRVAARTRINEPPTDSSVILSTTAFLHCGVSHDPNIPVTIDWLFNGKLIDYDPRRSKVDDGSLKITSVSQADAGTYTCSVKSTNGDDHQSAIVKVIELPFAPSGVTAELSPTNSRNAIVSWITPEDGNSPIIYYLIQGQKIISSEAKTSPNSDPVTRSSREDAWETLVKDAPPTTSYELERLSPSATYVFRVSAINSVGEGPYSDPSDSVTIPQEAPSEPPMDFRAESAATTTIMTEWKRPPEAGLNGVLRGYMIEFRLTGYKSLPWDRVNISDPDETYRLLRNLMVFRKYDVRIAAYNDRGIGVFSETLTESTVQGTPTQPPSDVVVAVLDSTSIRVSWLPPPKSTINGVNQGYKIRVYNVDSPASCPPGCNASAYRVEKEAVIEPGVGRHEGVVSGLKKYNRYNVTVLCFTSAGNGVESPVKLVVTDQDVPGKVSAMVFTSVLDSSITVEWKPPLSPNGVVVNYTVYHSETSAPVGEERSQVLSADRSKFVVSGLKPQTFYSVAVSASTVVGEGPREISQVQSGVPPELPGPASNLEVTDVKASTILLRFNHGNNGKTTITKWIVQASIIEDNDGGATSWKKIYVTTDPNIVDSIRVGNLRPYTQYLLRIVKENIVGLSSPSASSRQFRTSQAAPVGAPENVILRAVNSTAVRVTWTPLPLVKWNGEPSGYRILYSSKVEDSNQSSAVVNDSNVNTVVLTGLDAWVTYSFSMAAYNTFGTSQYEPVGEERTMEDVPSAGPTAVSAESVTDSATQLLVGWEPVPEGSENGDIQGYTIYHVIDNDDGTRFVGDDARETRVKNPHSRSVTLTNLLSYTSYRVTVSAFTRVGDGVKSAAVSARTGEAAPGPPSDVMFPEVGRDYARIAWEEPVFPNGVIIGYEVDYVLKQYVDTSAPLTSSGTLSSTTKTHKFSNLTPEKYYTFSIKALTQLGWGPTFSLDVFTRQNRRISDPPGEPIVGRGQTEARSVAINLNSVEGDAPTRYFTVQYQVFGDFGSGGVVARGRRDAGGGTHRGGDAYPHIGSWRVASHWSEWETYEPREKILATDSSHILINLQPYTKYRFRVSATNDVGTSDFSPPSNEIVTKADTPGEPPVDVVVTPVTETSVEVTFFDPPRSSWYGPSLLGYYVQYRILTQSQWLEQVEGASSGGIFSPSSTRRRVVLSGLTKDERYEIKAAAYSAKGQGKESRVVVVDVGEAVPSAAPLSLAGVAFSSTELNVTWESPPEDRLNGNLLGYKLFFVDLETGRGGVRVSGYKNRFAVLQRLRKFALYDLKILAYNSAGDGRNSTSVVRVRTLEDLPGPPRDVEFFNLTLNSLKLAWSAPVDANGVIRGYEIMYEEDEPLDGVSKSVKIQVEADRSAEHDIRDLMFHARYNFSVRAKTSKGYGPFKSSIVTIGPQPGSPSAVTDLGYRSTSDALVLFWKYSQINKTVGFILEKKSRDVAEGEGEGRVKRSSSKDWTPWSLEVMESSKITGYKLKWGKLKQGSEYKFRVVAFNYRGPSEPVETKDAIRPLALSAASAWWTEGWFKIVVALGGIIIVAILVATFIVIGRNSSQKEQAQMKRQGTMQRVEHVRPGMGHSNPVDVSDEILCDAGGGFATCDFEQRQSLRKSIKRAVNNNNNPRQNSYREPPLPTPAANYSEDDDDDEEDTSFSQGQRDKRDEDVTSRGEGDSGSSELTGKDIDDSLSADEDDDLPLPPPPAQLDLQTSSSVTGFSTLPQNYSQYVRNAPISSGISASTHQISNPTSTFSQPENPYSALHTAHDPGRPPTHPTSRAGLSQSQYLQQRQQPTHQRAFDYKNPQQRTQPSGQTPRQSDSPRAPPPYGVPASQGNSTFTPPGSHDGGSQNGSQFGGSGGGRMTSSPVPPPPPPPSFPAPEDSSPLSHPSESVSPRGLASGAHFDSTSFVSHYSSANEVLANGGSLRRQPKRRPPSANNSSHYGGGGSDVGSDISLTEVGNSVGLFGARVNYSPSGNAQHQPYYLNQTGAGSRAPLPGFSSFV